ncbi:hypothetical protein CDL15_Pgr023464 [Punica granatum]|uniref:Uncharacterized protein n=1 Tax=Punica granatum TaxID=22663 RepID=A0A218W7N6_PUNGR|nr:hypothetical protein CDL15_Pgr023464 [Punica granatum]
MVMMLSEENKKVRGNGKRKLENGDDADLMMMQMRIKEVVLRPQKKNWELPGREEKQR